jgi:hypothetical protein
MGKVPSFLKYIVGRRSSSFRKSATITAPRSSRSKVAESDNTSASDDCEDFLPLVAASPATDDTATTTTASNRQETPKQRKLRKSPKSLRRLLLSPSSSSKLKHRLQKKSDRQNKETDTMMMTAGWSVLEDDDDDDYYCHQENENAVDEFERATVADQHDLDVTEDLVSVSVAQWNPKQGIAFTYSL